MNRILLAATIALVSFRPGAERAAAFEPRPLAIGAAAPDFALPGVDGKIHKLADFADAKILAVVFTCNHCPTAQAYEERIKSIAEDYRDRGVQIVAISPNSADAVRLDELGYTDLGDSLEDMKIRAKDHHFNFPYLYDGETQSAAKAYGPVATPHVFLFDAQRTLRYCGRIDDNENPMKATSSETRDAIEAMLAGRKPPVETTRTFGCSVKWADKIESAKAALANWDKETAKLDQIDAAGVRELAANHTDKVRLFNVWSTTCGPCVIEFPKLVEMHRMYRGRGQADQTGFELVTITTDPAERRENALKFLNKQHASTKNYIFADGDLDKLPEALYPKWQGAMPLTILVRPGGKVVYAQTGEMDALAVRRAIVDNISRYYFDVPLEKVAAEAESDADASKPDAEGFYTLFDGKSLAGWKVGDNAESVRIEEGAIVCNGDVAHLFYVGPVHDHDFKDFHLKAQVMTKPGSNSGIYFHTEYQESGWPAKGYECQVNNSQGDWRRTGSLYAIDDVKETKAKDDEWFDYDIIVKGKQITLKINGETTVDYTEPENRPAIKGHEGKVISHGTIALQCHDPGSTAMYKNIRIKPLE